MAGCPDPETLARFADGLASDTQAGELRAHLDGCATCREVLVALAHAERSATAAATAPVPSGTLLGRYEVKERLGAGGMGLVVAAWDKQLGRDVALKLVRPELLGDQQGDQTRARMVREAQLMAQVNHPNVVTVYDVGTLDDGIFITMELVKGQTLRAWLEVEVRPWREVVDRFLAAGRGLAAAHAAGLVHRDFKPDNVLLGAAGGVQVTDFGLAWSAQAPQGPAPEALPVSPVSGLSRQSAVLGTPAYMAPEQLRGQAVDARADQFSFCVGLWEAVHRARPFEARHVGELLQAIDRGPRKSAKGGASPSPPAWLDALLARGLCPAPAGRFSTMGELLDRLEQRLRPPRRGLRWLAAGAVPLGVAAGALAPRLLAPPCEDGAARVDAIWNPISRREAEQRFQGSQAQLAGPAWKQVEGGLDAWAIGWRKAWVGACEAPGKSGEARARSTLCLEARLADFAVMVELMKSAQGAVIDAAPLVLARLDGPEPCLRGETLATVPLPASAEARQQVARARLLAAQADAARASGRHASAMRLAKEAVAEASLSGHRPAEAEALLALAEEQRARADFERAAQTLDQALLAAESGRHFEAIARIALQKVFSVGTHSMKPAEAEAWLTRARGALEQMPRPELEAEVALATAFLRTSQGTAEAALAPAREALATFQRLGKAVRALDSQSVLAQALAAGGQPQEALALAEQVARGRAELFGANHPHTVHSRLDLGSHHAAAGQLGRAVQTLTAELEAAQTAGLPPLTLLRGQQALARSLTALGRHREALGVHRAVLAGTEQALGKTHRYAALARDALAQGLREAGDLDGAQKEHLLALELWGTAPGATADQRAASHAALAWTFAERGQPDGALQEAALARALDPGPRRPFAFAAPFATAQAAEAAARLALGQPDEALEAAQGGVAATLDAAGPETALARARCFRVQGDAARARGTPGGPSWAAALSTLRAADPALAPGLQAQLGCRVAAAAGASCDEARACAAAVEALEPGSAPWAKGALAPLALVKKACRGR